MVNPWNDPDDITDRLRFLENQADQWELQDIVDQAHREALNMVGSTVVEKIRPTHEDQRKFRLAFAEISDFIVVEHDDEKLTEGSNEDYTTAKDPGRTGTHLDFTQSFFDDEMDWQKYKAYVEYVPQDFADLELMIAIHEVLSERFMQTASDEMDTKTDKYRKRIERLKKNINRKAGNLTGRQRGERLPANSRRSDRY